MKLAIYTWLPRIFGCHCRDDRSFHYKGKKFPVCARCTGELVGLCLGIIGAVFYRPSIFTLILMMLPMIADGMIQLFTRYESNNVRRLWTGMLFGYALMMLFAVTTMYALEYGRSWGTALQMHMINI